jgi:hypothetical protein
VLRFLWKALKYCGGFGDLNVGVKVLTGDNVIITAYISS